ncbi:E3 ubiquitin-protein ligase RBBP6-like [Rhynochetos jubatus]
MSCVHYKFFSKLTYDTVTFNGLHISMHDLKQQIMRREKLKASHCDLQITNAQTKEEYTDDKALIPRNSSVIVRRIPVGGAQATSKAGAVKLQRNGQGLPAGEARKRQIWNRGRERNIQTTGREGSEYLGFSSRRGSHVL